MIKYATILLFVFVFFALFAAQASAEEDKPAVLPTYICNYTTSPVVVDGRLNDAAWQSAQPVELVLVQTGAPVSLKTTALFLWDDQYLYVAFHSQDTDIWGTFTKRDNPIFIEEVVEVFIDSNCNQTDYYEVDISPRNTLFDSVITNSTGFRPDPGLLEAWTCVGCKSAVKVVGTLDNRQDTDRYWDAEIAIPFSRIGSPPGHTPVSGDSWRINLYRIDLSPNEELQAWSPTLTSGMPNFHVPGRFGILTFKR